MLARGFMTSGQFYVMFVHDEPLVKAFLDALHEVLAELDALHDTGRLQAEAGEVKPSGGFARLA